MAEHLSTTTVEPTSSASPNADVIAGLREVAGFLEQHPELPQFYASLHYAHYGKGARETLTTVAEALGDRATESVDSIGHVVIGTDFGSVVRFRASANPNLLGAAPRREPEYEPILPRDGDRAVG